MSDRSSRQIKRLNLFSLLLGGLFTLFIVVIFYIEEQRLHDLLLDREGSEFIIHQQKQFDRYHNNALNLLTALRTNEMFIDYLKNPDKTNTANVRSLFTTTVQAEQHINQLRYIDSKGMELIRVDRDSKSFTIHSYNDTELSDKSSREYFTQAIKLKHGEHYNSRFELNIEDGEIEFPHNPVWRAAVHVDAEREQKGIIVINFFAKGLFKDLLDSSLFKVYLYDQNAYVLDSNDPEQEVWTRYTNTNVKIDTAKLFLKDELISNEDIETVYLGILPNTESIISVVNQENILFIVFVLIFISFIIAQVLTKILKKQYRALHQHLIHLHNGARIAKLGYLEIDFTSKMLKLDVFLQELLQVPLPKDKPKLLSITEFLERYVPQEQHFIIQKALDDALTNNHQGNNTISHDCILPRGQRIHVLQRYHVQYDETNNPTVGYSVIQDITQAHDTEQKLRHAMQNAKNASRAKSEFLTNMSHEVRTPMNAVLGFVDHILKKEKDASIIKQLEIIKNSGKILINILNDILDFSKIESGKMYLDLQPCQIDHITKESMMLFEKQMLSKSISYDFIFSKDIPDFLLLDATRIQQIIMNLLGNAVKFTPENGHIGLEAEYDLTTEILTLCVADSGAGISLEHQKRIFNAFEQEDNSTTRKFGGTGLGLTICSRLISLMQGTIKVESEPDKGSRFIVTIPAIPCDAPVDEIVSSTDQEILKKIHKKILVVEDNKTNQLLIKLILDDYDLDYDIANDGNEAVEAYRQNTYSIILMDENMPNKNGIEATKDIREIESEEGREPTPIIAVTANALDGDRNRFLEAGMDDYLSKPFNEDDLIALIKRHV